MQQSALRELRGAARLVQTDLLALDLAGVTGHEAGLAQLALQGLVVLHQRAGDAQADGAGLAGGAAAVGRHEDVEALGVLRELERLAHDHPRGLAAEELVERTRVDGDGAGTAAQEHAGGGGFATAGAVILGDCHDLDIQDLRLLGGVRVLGTLVDLELAIHRAAQGVLREHALDRVLDDALRVALKRLPQGLGLQVADVPGEAVVHLVGELVSGDVDLLGVDHDEVIAGIDVRGVDGLVLAAEATRDLGAQATEGLAGGVDHVPVALDGLVLGGKGFHRELSGVTGRAGCAGHRPAELRLAFSRSGNARGGIVPGRAGYRNLPAPAHNEDMTTRTLSPIDRLLADAQNALET